MVPRGRKQVEQTRQKEGADTTQGEGETGEELQSEKEGEDEKESCSQIEA